ncbi:transcriptional regulator, Crp/Fnr family [Brucella lupini]|uniref:Transcriptional regulator, Crp/Fnr family n=1 Tax=Brucella lupini TaxID=255457 RepID=A0A256GG19_9HYPH|nr:transcriptional regulator, Crp/Fnr family [Brucella lupini]
MYDESKLHNNRLLKSLPPDILNSIYSSLEPFTLERGQVIVRANQPIDYLYFLCGGISSVIAVTTRGQLAEAGHGRTRRVFTNLRSGWGYNQHS